MDQDQAARIRALGEIAAEFDLDAIRVRTGETEIEIVRRDPSVHAPPLVYTAPEAPAGAAATASPAPGDRSGPVPSADVRKVTAPIVGVFYRSPNPDADSYVEVGSRVAVGDTLCILEAMKLMNEITSDYAGVVTRILAENSDLVPQGQELFWIEP